MNALGTILILFIVMVVVSVLGVLYLLVSKNEKAKNVVFYVMAVWAMIIAFVNATALPTNYVVSQVIAWAIGALAVVAIIVRLVGKSEKKLQLSTGLVVVSVVAGIIKLFVM